MSVNGAAIRFRQDGAVPPILHLKLFNPLDDHYGLSPLEAAARAIDIHNAAGAWNKALLDNAARPSGALVYAASDGGNLTDEQFDAAEERAGDKATRARPMPGGRMVLEGGLDWKEMALRPRTWISSRRSMPRRARSRWPSACRRCCSAFPATTPSPISPKPTAPSGAKP